MCRPRDHQPAQCVRPSALSVFTERSAIDSAQSIVPHLCRCTRHRQHRPPPQNGSIPGQSNQVLSLRHRQVVVELTTDHYRSAVRVRSFHAPGPVRFGPSSPLPDREHAIAETPPSGHLHWQYSWASKLELNIFLGCQPQQQLEQPSLTSCLLSGCLSAVHLCWTLHLTRCCS